MTGPNAAARASAQLRAANINPRTGLATDYLNHFNEAVMLLEMIPDMPECAEDFLTWRPLSYAEHFRLPTSRHAISRSRPRNTADPQCPRRIRPHHPKMTRS